MQPLVPQVEELSTVAGLRAAAAVVADAVDAELWRLSGAEVEELIGLAAATRSALDRLDAVAVREGLERGLHREQGFGAVDWVRSCQRRTGAPVGDVAHAARVVRVVQCASRVGGRAVWSAFRLGTLPLGKADQIGRFEREVTPVVAADTVLETVDHLVDAASDTADTTGLTERELRTAIRYAGELMKPERDLDREHEALARGRSLTSGPGPGGLCAYRLLLDPAGAAVVDAAVAGLSAPVTGPDREPDLRPAAQRRADALVEIVRRGVSSPGEQPTTAKAQVIVTMTLDQLLADLATHHGARARTDTPAPGAAAESGPAFGAGVEVAFDAAFGTSFGAGAPTTFGSAFGAGVGAALGAGAGVTATGQVLSGGEVRRMACDAGIVPMVLGSRGEVLDVGREQRLFTLGQRRALWRRDGGCTYPGCTIPPQWCDAHHVIWWSRGGTTDVSNAALLCGRHHTLVHRRDLTATVTATGVVWHTGLA
ncbi:HNH endonuclease signature motif containing protein [Luteipulveratus halotolerans]|nr:HNH endonuclease signature motif containing protein [Luteipulveratus halotolerans]